MNQLEYKFTKQKLDEVRNKELEYKEKVANNHIQKVSVELKGRKGSYATRVAREYKRIDEELKRITEEREKLKEYSLEYYNKLFDAEDEIIQRIVETSSVTITLTKPAKVKTVHFDEEGFFNELSVLLPELSEQLEELRKQYTVINEFTRKSAIKVSEGPISNIKDKLSKLIQKLSTGLRRIFINLKDFDSSLLKIIEKYKPTNWANVPAEKILDYIKSSKVSIGVYIIIEVEPPEGFDIQKIKDFSKMKIKKIVRITSSYADVVKLTKTLVKAGIIGEDEFVVLKKIAVGILKRVDIGG